MNSMELVLNFPQNAHQVSPGMPQADVSQLPTPVHQDLITTVSDVSHINLAIKEKSGMINNLNAFALIALSSMVLNVLNAPLVNNMPLVDASAQKELSLTEFNVPLELLINVFLLPIPTGTELTVSASQDLPQIATNVSAKVLLSEIIAKDALPSLTQSGETEFVNAITVMLMLTELVP